MSAKRGTTTFSGVLLVDKPGGMTSHDVVNIVRRATGERRVGHAGTLDPMATGLLVVLVGPATRLASYLTAAHKSYLARIVFGTETDTDDATGTVTATADVPAQLADPAFAADKVAALVGTHEQVPPVFSAIKKDGQTAYRMARKGESVELEPRSVEIRSATLSGIDSDQQVAWNVEFDVSKGTYIRSIARDLGRELGTVAHLGALRRTVSGGLCVEDALDPAIIETAGAAGVESLFADPFSGLAMPRVDVTAEGAARVATGARLGSDDVIGELPEAGEFAVGYAGRLLAIHLADGATSRAQVVLPGGVGGQR